jgi:surfactin family lipopeptide synthetase A
MVQVHQKVREAFSREVSIVDLFRYPTINALAGFLSNDAAAPRPSPPAQRDRSAARAELLKRQGRLRPGRK